MQGLGGAIRDGGIPSRKLSKSSSDQVPHANAWGSDGLTFQSRCLSGTCSFTFCKKLIILWRGAVL